MNSKLIEILLKAIELEEEEHVHDTLWVTDLCQCLRRSYYSLKYPLKPEQKLKRSLIIGKSIHLYLESLLLKHKDKLGIDIEIEKPVRYVIDGMVIRGYADIVLGNILYEIKTTSKIPVKPYFEHILQAGFYAYVLHLREFCIVYINDNGYKEFCMETNDGIINIIKDRVRVLKEALESGKPPPREKSVLCNYCPYKTICFEQKTLT